MITLALVIKIILLVSLIALVSYFAGTETALTSLSHMSLKKLKEKYVDKANDLVFWEKNPNDILATLLVGTNLSLIGIGVLSASIALDVSNYFVYKKALLILTIPIFITLLTLVFGEIWPKVFSRYQAERVAIFGLRFLMIFKTIAYPITRLILKISERIINIFSKRAIYDEPFLGSDELKVLLLFDETLPISGTAREIIRNILDFAKTKISHVMVPRSEIQAVSLDQDREKIIDQIIEKGYSRIPVYRGSLDNIVGIIYSKDLTFAWRGGSLFIIDDLIRPVYFVPETARIGQVLREFRTGHQHMAIVVDEFGSTIGIATIEDIVERIVGEIWDEYDIQEKKVVSLPDNSYLIPTNESLDKINEELKLNLPVSEFMTISGWVLDLFGRIPKVGEKVEWGDYEIEVVDADRKKVLKIKIKKQS